MRHGDVRDSLSKGRDREGQTMLRKRQEEWDELRRQIDMLLAGKTEMESRYNSEVQLKNKLSQRLK